ncbi:hypothetical protein L195_g022530 [Trifolium pratense]|uniref:Uncharacterized protein n=1 Tax=Trifolium pratense TaxID=57577 RepID=A0A2K3N8A6_TRIPR|nr:hypothetical protein L195_g022530 [Trifolium pratense]
MLMEAMLMEAIIVEFVLFLAYLARTNIARCSSPEFFYQIKHALMPSRIGPTLEDKWMVTPDMRFLLARRYKQATVGNKGYIESYFLLVGAPP